MIWRVILVWLLVASGIGNLPATTRPTGYGVNAAEHLLWRAREVDATGQWLSYDPLWNAGDPNGQSFCGGDPVNGFDPNGKCGVNVPPNLSTTINPNITPGRGSSQQGDTAPCRSHRSTRVCPTPSRR